MIPRLKSNEMKMVKLSVIQVLRQNSIVNSNQRIARKVITKPSGGKRKKREDSLQLYSSSHQFLGIEVLSMSYQEKTEWAKYWIYLSSEPTGFSINAINSLVVLQKRVAAIEWWDRRLSRIDRIGRVYDWMKNSIRVLINSKNFCSVKSSKCYNSRPLIEKKCFAFFI